MPECLGVSRPCAVLKPSGLLFLDIAKQRKDLKRSVEKARTKIFQFLIQIEKKTKQI